MVPGSTQFNSFYFLTQHPMKNPKNTTKTKFSTTMLILALAFTVGFTSGCIGNDVDQIKQAMSERHNRPVDEIRIDVQMQTNDHMYGHVFFGEGGPGEGGWFLAAKVSDSWVIVQDGNGTIDCAIVQPYNFPADMIEGCV